MFLKVPNEVYVTGENVNLTDDLDDLICEYEMISEEYDEEEEAYYAHRVGARADSREEYEDEFEGDFEEEEIPSIHRSGGSLNLYAFMENVGLEDMESEVA